MPLNLPLWISELFSVNLETPTTWAFLTGNAVGLLWAGGIVFNGFLPTDADTTFGILSAGYFLVACCIGWAHDSEAAAVYGVGVYLSTLLLLLMASALI